MYKGPRRRKRNSKNPSIESLTQDMQKLNIENHEEISRKAREIFDFAIEISPDAPLEKEPPLVSPQHLENVIKELIKLMYAELVIRPSGVSTYEVKKKHLEEHGRCINLSYFILHHLIPESNESLDEIRTQIKYILLKKIFAAFFILYDVFIENKIPYDQIEYIYALLLFYHGIIEKKFDEFELMLNNIIDNTVLKDKPYIIAEQLWNDFFALIGFKQNSSILYGLRFKKQKESEGFNETLTLIQRIKKNCKTISRVSRTNEIELKRKLSNFEELTRGKLQKLASSQSQIVELSLSSVLLTLIEKCKKYDEKWKMFKSHLTPTRAPAAASMLKNFDFVISGLKLYTFVASVQHDPQLVEASNIPHLLYHHCIPSMFLLEHFNSQFNREQALVVHERMEQLFTIWGIYFSRLPMESNTLKVIQSKLRQLCEIFSQRKDELKTNRKKINYATISYFQSKIDSAIYYPFSEKVQLSPEEDFKSLSDDLEDINELIQEMYCLYLKNIKQEYLLYLLWEATAYGYSLLADFYVNNEVPLGINTLVFGRLILYKVILERINNPFKKLLTKALDKATMPAGLCDRMQKMILPVCRNYIRTHIQDALISNLHRNNSGYKESIAQASSELIFIESLSSKIIKFSGDEDSVLLMLNNFTKTIEDTIEYCSSEDVNSDIFEVYKSIMNFKIEYEGILEW